MSSAIQPSLRVAGRDLDYNGRLESFCLHPLDRVDHEIVDKLRQRMLAGRR
jgi:hypothetical protein